MGFFERDNRFVLVLKDLTVEDKGRDYIASEQLLKEVALLLAL